MDVRKTGVDGRNAGAIVRVAQFETFRASDWSAILGRYLLDADDAALYLGIARNSLDYAAYRRRIPFVQYGAKKLFPKADLDDYRAARGRGRESRLTPAARFRVK